FTISSLTTLTHIPPRSTLFPYTTLFRSELQNLRAQLTAIIGDLQDQQQAFVETMARAVDIKSKYKNNHSKSVADLSKELCHQLRSEEHTSELQSRFDLVCRLLLEKKK